MHRGRTESRLSPTGGLGAPVGGDPVRISGKRSCIVHLVCSSQGLSFLSQLRSNVVTCDAFTRAALSIPPWPPRGTPGEDCIK
ncbi:protein of unknown function [Streptomyces sp. KY75]|nr:protein of unknown function [Streptomyces sp. KY75]CAD5982788.1 protein of unknown function [Streptomyces sp. KY70]